VSDIEEDGPVRLLRLAGPRAAAPDERAGRVREAVHAHWQRTLHRRGMRRRLLVTSGALAAAAAAVFVIARTGDTTPPAIVGGQIVAVVERVNGRGMALAGGDRLRSGDWIQTGPEARLGLRFSDGTAVRLDAASRVRPLSSTAVEVSAGAIYVDTGRDSGGFEVRTPIATARDVGTQFELRLIDEAVRLRVRTGTVELSDGTRLVSGRSGTEIVFSAARAETKPFPSYGTEWDWTASAAPAWDAEGMVLSAFLDRLTREQGWTLEYADPALARDASDIVLHASVAGLAPADALAVAISTSGLVHRLTNGQLLVLRDDGRP
jgi:hypothetical protein